MRERETERETALEQSYDARGLICPLPVLKAQKLLAGMAPGSVLRLRADDPMARIDMPHFCRQSGHELMEMEETAAGLLFVIRRA